MANSRKKVYYSAITIREMLSNEPISDYSIIRSVFDQTENSYTDAISRKDVHGFQIAHSGESVLILTDLHYVDDRYLCGRVGCCSSHVNLFLRESNPQTFSGNELTPSAGNLFENYSYFAISIAQRRIGYLNNDKVSPNIPKLVISILRRNLGSQHYELELTTMLDYDIKEKIKKLDGSIVVQGTICGQDAMVVGGMRSLKRLETAMSTRMRTTIKLKASITKKLSDSDIDEITDVVNGNEGFSAFTLAEEESEEKETIDVLKRQAYLSRSIELSTEEQKSPDAIWRKMCSTF